ncbi:MAG: ANTAR domain-containing protein [Oscillospiraceae bacterium]|nr:ANTAR domain-containing protein [Oscillospiraceae bacterium]
MLVSASEKFNAAARSLLPCTDYYPVAVAHSVGEARRRRSGTDFDLVLVNAPLPDDMGVDLAVEVSAESDAGVLLLVRSELYEEIYAQVLPFGVVTLSKPTNLQMISQNLRVLCAMRERMRRMRQHQATVEEKIEEIRCVNRAKWALIEHRHMTEPEAHRFLSRQAMERRLSKREIAEEILQMYP